MVHKKVNIKCSYEKVLCFYKRNVIILVKIKSALIHSVGKSVRKYASTYIAVGSLS